MPTNLRINKTKQDKVIIIIIIIILLVSLNLVQFEKIQFFAKNIEMFMH